MPFDFFHVDPPGAINLNALAQDIANAAAEAANLLPSAIQSGSSGAGVLSSIAIADQFALELLHNNPNSPEVRSLVTLRNLAITDMAHNIRS
jgi:hypothetical protein